MKTWKEMVIRLQRENDKLREAIAAWPRSPHRHDCKMLEPVGGFYLETRCNCGAAQIDVARAEARKLAGLEGTNANV